MNINNVDLEHLIRLIIDAVEVTQCEPAAEGRPNLQKAPEQNERPALVDRGNPGRIVLR